MSYLVGVGLEELDRPRELLHLLRVHRVLHEFRALQVLLNEHVPRGGAFRVLRDELVELGLQERVVLADHPGDLAAGPERGLRVKLDLGQHLCPEPRQVVVHDEVLNQPGVEHLEKILVLEVGRGDADFYRRLPALGEVDVELLHALVKDRPLPDEHLAAGEVVCARERRGFGPRHDDLGHVLQQRIREVHLLPPLGRYGDAGRDDVPTTLEQSLRERVAAHRKEGHVDREVAGLVLLVEMVFELLEGVVGDAPLRGLVDEVIGLVVDEQDPDGPAFPHGVEVAGLLEYLGRQGDLLGRLLLSRERRHQQDLGGRERYGAREKGSSEPHETSSGGTPAARILSSPSAARNPRRSAMLSIAA